MSLLDEKPLKYLNFTVFLQQQRYIVAILFLFYLEHGLTLSDFLLFQSIFYFTGLIAEIPAGYIGDIFPRKNILIFSYLLFAIRVVLWIVAPNYYTILLGEILYGLSKAFYRGVSDGYIYDYLKQYNNTNTMLNKYGTFNFFMSNGSAISCLLGACLFKFVGFSALLIIELVCNLVAILILCFLPNVIQQKPKFSCKEHFAKIYDVLMETAKNNKINMYLLYTAVLFGMTSILVWNFQPYMKHFALASYWFGIVYFINHILRAIGSLNASTILAKIKLQKVGLIVWFLYLCCLFLLVWGMHFNNKYICLAVLMFVCISIGVQMVFNVGNLSRLHSFISSNIRATASSVNSMLSTLFSGCFLMLFKFLVDFKSQEFAIYIFAGILIMALIIIRKIYSEKYN